MDAYERRKERERERQSKQSEEGRDIAPIPECVDPDLRARCDASLETFCLEVFPEKFTKDFSPDHKKAIAKMEASVVEGLLFALAMPRGSGKTTLIICAVLWAIVTGRRRYVALIGPTAIHARKMLRTLRVELECNDRLFELYPEATHPVRKLEGIANRCRGQLYQGERTHIEWTKDNIVFATIDGAQCAGAIITAAGITGSIRGMQHASPTGKTIRPDLFIVDDPQTKKSAKSETQCQDRLETIQGDILGLAGPGEAISGFVLCTVIRKDDVADQLLDHEKHPEWQGERFQLIYDWPKEQKLWDQYAILLADELSAGRGTKAATEFYRKHRAKMDEGVKPAWEARHRPDEVSATQHVFNLLLQDEEAFWCEYQNEPKDPREDSELLTVDQLMAKHSGYLRGVVHPEADTLTAFIDVQGKCLYWIVVAWRTSDFSGWIVDHGAWPEQGISYFKMSGIRKTLEKKYPRAGLEGRIRAGLVDLIDHLLTREFKTPIGSSVPVARIGVDAAWGPSTKVVQGVCAEHERKSQLVPCFGKGLKPNHAPMALWPKKPGERRGDRWLVRRSEGGGHHQINDTNYWKTFVHNRFSTAAGDFGSLYLPKPARHKSTEHKMLAEHMRSETRTLTEGDGRTFDVWELPNTSTDNHLFDCLVHAAAIAAREGAKLREHRPTTPKKKKKRRKRTTQLVA